jgi:predicted  nucleic acid-binding Zn-ribbon protein
MAIGGVTFGTSGNQVTLDANNDGQTQSIDEQGGQITAEELIASMVAEGYSREAVIANLDSLVQTLKESTGVTVTGLDAFEAASLVVPFGGPPADPAGAGDPLTVDPAQVSPTDATLDTLDVSGAGDDDPAVAGLSAEVSSLSAQLDAATAEVAQCQAEITSAQGEITAAQAEIVQCNAEITQCTADIAQLNLDIDHLNINMAELQKLLIELQDDYKDLVARLDCAQKMRAAITDEMAWADQQLAIWSQGNPNPPETAWDGLFASQLPQDQPPGGTPVAGGLGSNGLTDGAWGSQESSLAAAAEMMGRTYPNTDGDPAIAANPAQQGFAAFETKFAAFTAEHRPVGDARTDPKQMVAALEAYKASLQGMAGECDTEIASIQGQMALVQTRIDDCKAKIVECQDKIKDCEEKIKVLQAHIKELQEKIKQLEEKIKQLEEKIKQLQARIKTLQPQIEALRAQLKQKKAELEKAKKEAAARAKQEQAAQAATATAQPKTYNVGDIMNNERLRSGRVKA